MAFKKGNIPWNQGLTKETDERVASSIEKMRKTQKKLHAEGKWRTWNKGLTKDTDVRLKKMGEKAKGKVITEEQRRKISQTLTGYKHSNETRKRMSESQRKKWENPFFRQNHRNGLINFWNTHPERKQKLREAMTRTKLSKEARRKISRKLKGNKNALGNKNCLGRKLSQEHKRKISESEKGRVFSEEQKRKMSKAQKRLWKNLEYRTQQSKKISKTLKKIWAEYNEEDRQQQRASMLKGLLKRPTNLERQFIKICQKNNLPFKYVGDGGYFIGTRNPDFIHNNGKKLCIEVANTLPQHHPEGYAEERTQYFMERGWGCLVFMSNKLDESHVLSKLDEAEMTN